VRFWCDTISSCASWRNSWIRHVERRRAAAEHGEQERQRRETALPTRQQRELLHVLTARLGLDLDPRVEQIVGLGEFQHADPTGEQCAEQLSEVGAHVGECAGEDVLDLLIDRLDDPGEIATGRPDIFELFLEERVALLEFGELLEGEWVDRTEEPELAVELSYATSGGGTLGKLGCFGPLGRRGFDVEISTQRLDGGFEAEFLLGLLDVESVRFLPDFVESTLGIGTGGASRVERGGHRADFVALAAPLLGQFVVLTLDDRAMTIDEQGEPIDGDDRSLDLLATFGRTLTRILIGFEPSFGLGDSRLEELVPLVEPGVSHLELAASGCEDGGAGLEVGTCLTAGLRGIDLGLFVSIERWQDGRKISDTNTLTLDVFSKLGHRSIEPLELCPELTALPERP